MNRIDGSPSRVELLTWDSSFWGVEAARIWAGSTMELMRALDECRTLGVRWASLLAPVTNTTLVDSAVRAGFQIVDIRITMSLTIDCQHDEPSMPPLVEASELQQAQALVVGAFETSRFSVDTHLDSERCNEFYRTWVSNSFSGELADAIVVSRRQGTLDAFVTVRRQPDGTASLPLVAVRRDRRGLGIGARLVRDTVTWLGAEGPTTVSVTTQLANVAAIRLYESLGFSIRESGVWLHRWFNSETSG